MFTGIDLSSDTATKPSMAMRRFMLNAEVGDEQKFEDPTTLRLEKMAAELCGFESAFFLPSATMANQIAIQALSKPGDVLLAAENCHLFQSEHEGLAKHSQVRSCPIHTVTGIFRDLDLRHYYLGSKKAYNPSGFVMSIENTVNLGGGSVWPKSELSKIIVCAKEFNMKTHLDGSRIFNASVSSNLPPHKIVEGFDMVTVCLSKGLGCPVGGLLIFNEPYYQSVRHLKKLMGGSMRQTGILAAAGIYAFEKNIKRLAIDHKHAKLFATELSNIKKIKLITTQPETNIILFEWIDNHLSTQDFLRQCKELGLRFSQAGKYIRAVMHLDISFEDVIKAVEIVRTITLKS